MINKQDLLPEEEAVEHVADLRCRFELELSKYRAAFRWHVFHLRGFSATSGNGTHDALATLAHELGKSPPRRPVWPEADPRTPEEVLRPQVQISEDSSDPADLQAWWDAFLHGTITPWTHRDYLRAAYLTLLLPEHRDSGILKVATDFARMVHSFKQRPVSFPQQPESR